MLRGLALLVACMTMAPPSAWCHCEHHRTAPNEKLSEVEIGELSACTTCKHHHRDADLPASAPDPLPASPHDEPCQCQASQAILALPIVPTLPSADGSDAITLHNASDFTAIGEAQATSVFASNRSPLLAYDASRARILRC